MTNDCKSSTDLLNQLYPFIVETCNNVLKNEYATDLAHDIYITMSSLDAQYIVDLQNDNRLKRYIIKCIVNASRNTEPSRRKLYTRREHIELIENSDFIENEQEFLLNWHLLSDFEVLFLSKFVESKNALEMSKAYNINKDTVGKYLKRIKKKLCG